jgi:hypothetical protein
MRKKLIALLLCFLFVPAGVAQIQVEVLLDQETYLAHESLPVKVRVRNRSGQTIKLGNTEDWLTFTVENSNGSVVSQLKPVDVSGEEFVLPSAHRATKTVDIAPCYDLTKFGRYYITAVVKVPQWGQEFESRPKIFGISSGSKIWETVFGLPDPDRQGQPELRKYQLLQANHVKRLSLYFRVMDADETTTYKVYPLGEVISFSRPETMLDSWSNLHVLYQKGAQQFAYFVLTPDGLMLARETHEQTASRPTLHAHGEGQVKVSGGRRRVSADDLPPPDLFSEMKNKEEPIEAAEYLKAADAKKKEQ